MTLQATFEYTVLADGEVAQRLVVVTGHGETAAEWLLGDSKWRIGLDLPTAELAFLVWLADDEVGPMSQAVALAVGLAGQGRTSNANFVVRAEATWRASRRRGEAREGQARRSRLMVSVYRAGKEKRKDLLEEAVLKPRARAKAFPDGCELSARLEAAVGAT